MEDSNELANRCSILKRFHDSGECDQEAFQQSFQHGDYISYDTHVRNILEYDSKSSNELQLEVVEETILKIIRTFLAITALYLNLGISEAKVFYLIVKQSFKKINMLNSLYLPEKLNILKTTKTQMNQLLAYIGHSKAPIAQQYNNLLLVSATIQCGRTIDFIAHFVELQYIDLLLLFLEDSYQLDDEALTSKSTDVRILLCYKGNKNAENKLNLDFVGKLKQAKHTKETLADIWSELFKLPLLEQLNYKQMYSRVLVKALTVGFYAFMNIIVVDVDDLLELYSQGHKNSKNRINEFNTDYFNDEKTLALAYGFQYYKQSKYLWNFEIIGLFRRLVEPLAIKNNIAISMDYDLLVMTIKQILKGIVDE